MSSASQAGQRITVGRCEVYLHRMGSGVPVLYLHGTEGMSQLDTGLALLAQSHDVIAPDHPGYGQSGDSERVDTMSDLAMFYLDLLDTLKLNEVHLVGHSMGGWLALEIAVRNSTRLASLSLVNAAGIHVQGVDKGDLFICTPEESVSLLNHDAQAARARQAAAASGVDPRVIYRNRVSTARLCWSPRLFNPSLEKWLHRISLPTLILWGESDQVLPLAYAHQLAKCIGDARLVTVPACGHNLPYEHPDRFASELTTFIRSQVA